MGAHKRRTPQHERNGDQGSLNGFDAPVIAGSPRGRRSDDGKGDFSQATTQRTDAARRTRTCVPGRVRLGRPDGVAGPIAISAKTASIARCGTNPPNPNEADKYVLDAAWWGAANKNGPVAKRAMRQGAERTRRAVLRTGAVRLADSWRLQSNQGTVHGYMMGRERESVSQQ